MGRAPGLFLTAFAAISIAVPFQAQMPAGQQPPASCGSQNQKPEKPPKDSKLRQQSELALVRFVDGEFAKAVQPIPARKDGFLIRVGTPVDPQHLKNALNGGTAANPGDKVQITHLWFSSKEIRVDINGGSKKHQRLRDRVHVEMGGPGGVAGSGVPDSRASGARLIGATLILDFGGPVPDLTPDQLKTDLAAFLDFSTQRSAATNWLDTLPPEFKKAVEEKRAVVGMDRDMVLAAMGAPGKKVRERNEEGEENEDWIYGEPPETVIFVTFGGEKVIKVREVK
jgi:hypothetical protein